MTAAISAGYHIPEDLAITGCDHSEEGQNLTPSLTTVSFPVYELGEASVEKLMKLIHEENVPAITTCTDGSGKFLWMQSYKRDSCYLL